jgi:hypothetical protein
MREHLPINLSEIEEFLAHIRKYYTSYAAEITEDQELVVEELFQWD